MPNPFKSKHFPHVKGFLDEMEGEALYRLAQESCKNGPCLEIGSYCGKSTLYIGTACKENKSILFSIDHHRGSEEQQPGEEYFDPDLFDYQSFHVDTFRAFRKTLSDADLEDTVVPLVCKSAVAALAWKMKLSMVFIDGGHSLETVKTDYLLWSGHLMPGGYLLFHDIYKNPDEGGRAPYDIYRLAVSSGDFEEETMVKTLGVLRRK
jgi:predicted O-methyltransferase YrrM